MNFRVFRFTMAPMCVLVHPRPHKLSQSFSILPKWIYSLDLQTKRDPFNSTKLAKTTLPANNCLCKDRH